MRFIHTADWHLGRLFHGLHLTDDQRHVLDHFVALAKDASPDVILVAGDIYDRAVPPPEAVELLDDVLSRLILDLGIPVILIAGNHDSPNRLNFGARLLAGRKLFVTGNLPPQTQPVELYDAHGPVYFYPVPYAEPATVRQCLDCADAVDHNSATGQVLHRIRASHPCGQRSVVIAHAFVAGGSECESERPLSVGGAGTVDATHFAGFSYAALGHLHCPQSLNDGQTRYAGSLLKYSFDEADQSKGVYVVEMATDGSCACEPVEVPPRRNVRRISGRLNDLLLGQRTDDYLEVTLLDEGVVLDPMGRLRDVYPNVLHVTRAEAAAPTEGASNLRRPDLRCLSDVDLFRSFYRHVRNTDLSPAQEAAFVAVAEDLLRREREAQPAPPPSSTPAPAPPGIPAAPELPASVPAPRKVRKRATATSAPGADAS